MIALTIAGGVGWLLSFGAPAEKAGVVAYLRWHGLALWALAAIVYGAKRVIEFFFR